MSRMAVESGVCFLLFVSFLSMDNGQHASKHQIHHHHHRHRCRGSALIIESIIYLGNKTITTVFCVQQQRQSRLFVVVVVVVVVVGCYRRCCFCQLLHFVSEGRLTQTYKARVEIEKVKQLSPAKACMHQNIESAREFQLAPNLEWNGTGI